MTASKLPFRGIIQDMIHLWRMHKFVLEVRNQGRIINGDVVFVEYKDPTLGKVKKAYKKRKRMWRYPFTENEVNEIINDVTKWKKPFCKLIPIKDVVTIRIMEKGTELSSFSGYVEELYRRHKRTGIALTSAPVIIFILNKLW